MSRPARRSRRKRPKVIDAGGFTGNPRRSARAILLDDPIALRNGGSWPRESGTPCRQPSADHLLEQVHASTTDLSVMENRRCHVRLQHVVDLAGSLIVPTNRGGDQNEDAGHKAPVDLAR